MSIKANYKFLEHTADELFVAEAQNLSELFEQCALAVEEVMVDLSKIENKTSIEINGANKNIEHLLFDFLDDLIFYKDSEQLVFNKFDVVITKESEEYQLKCIASGEMIDNDKHDPKVDIKAITMHMFEVKKTDDGWKAKVLVDI